MERRGEPGALWVIALLAMCVQVTGAIRWLMKHALRRSSFDRQFALGVGSFGLVPYERVLERVLLVQAAKNCSWLRQHLAGAKAGRSASAGQDLAAAVGDAFPAEQAVVYRYRRL